MFGPGVAFAAIFLGTKEVLVQAFSAALPLPVLLRQKFSAVVLIITAGVNSCDRSLFAFLPATAGRLPRLLREI